MAQGKRNIGKDGTERKPETGKIRVRHRKKKERIEKPETGKRRVLGIGKRRKE